MTDTEDEASGALPIRPRTLTRWGIAGLATFAAVVLAVVITARVAIDSNAIEERLTRALDRSTEGRYQLEIDTVKWSLLDRSLRLEGITLRPDSQDQGAGEGRAPMPRRVRISVPAVQFEDIGIWPLLWRRALKIDNVLIQGPRVAIQTQASSTPRQSSAGADSATGAGGAISGLRVGQLRVEDARLTRGEKGAAPQDSLWGLSVVLNNLDLDSARNGAPKKYLGTRISEGDFDGYRRLLSNESYVLQVGSSEVSRQDSLFSVGTVRYTPTVTDSVFMRRHEYRVNRFHIGMEGVSVSGFDYRRFLQEGAVLARRVQVDSMNLDVYRDNHLPPRPNEPPPPTPQDLIERVQRSLRIDSLLVRDSRIGYTKRPKGVSETGSITFQDLWLSLQNITNDSQLMTASTPAVVKARTRVNDAGRLWTTLRIPLLAPNFSLSFQGRTGSLNPKALNETFVHLGGVRIESGDVDSLWFQADVQRGEATGTVEGVYRNLEVELLEKSGDRGLGDRLKTVVTQLALRSENLPEEEDLATGRIEHSYEKGDTFFKYLWHALRSGIYSLVGIDRLPR